MKYIDGFRETGSAAALRMRIAALGEELQNQNKTVRIMEVCGTHTMSIGRYGIRQMLPAGIELISGPGCPVCVTDQGFIDTSIELAASRRVLIATFGDMLKVPGSRSDLARCRSEGARVEVCYSPLDALELAQANPDQEVVFLGIGFETTTGPVISIVDQAISRSVNNISVLTAFKTVIPAMHALASAPDLKINAFLCPAHVSAIIGANAYRPIAADYRLPCVVAGFEPLDILLGLEEILKQVRDGNPRVENLYGRVVKPEGNKKIQSLVAKYLEPADVPWRGIGIIPGSGLALRREFEQYDAEKRHGVKIDSTPRPTPCRCGEVLKGVIKPPQCPLYGRQCVPQHPVGPCMVSSEGSCSAYFKYSGMEAV